MKALIVIASLAGLAVASSVSAQERTLQLDINSLAFQARDAAGAPSAFGGVTHTGSLVLQEQLPPSVLNDIAIRSTPFGPFLPQAFTGTLGDVLITINLAAGAVTGGSMMVHGGTDMYTANILPGGNVTPFVGGGFKVEALTGGGMFSGPSFAGVAIADFFANQGVGGLPGSFLNFRIQPNATGGGLSDVDMFVSSIPAPGAVGLLGLAGIVGLRRRR